MKKFFVAMMAVLAIVLSSCKHETCTLYVQNLYSQKAIVLFSHDKDCSSIEKSDMYAIAQPQNMYSMKDVKLKGLYAIVYVCEEVIEKGDETLEGYKRVVEQDLTEFDGFASVTVSIGVNGMPSFGSEGL